MYDGAIRINTKIDNKGAEKGINSLSGSLKKFAGLVGVTFGVSAIVNFSKVAVKEASKMQSSLVGLQSILEGQGRSFNKAQAFINDYISDGLIPMNDAVTAYKNLALRGYDDSQIKKTLISLKDASAFGKQASLSMGEAVSSATEGLKNENSILVDNAGVTKNVAKMWEEYAKSIGKSVNELSRQEKIQAEVNGVLEESKYQTGDATKYADTYAGSVSKFNATLLIFKQNLGGLLQGLFQGIMKGASVVIKALNNVVLMIGAIFESFTGKNPLNNMTSSSEKTAKDFNDVADSLDSGSKSAKEIKKSLAGFDEMNILSDNSTEKSSIGGSTSSSLLENTGGEFNIGNNSLENFNSMKKIINDLLPLVKGLIASMVTLFALKGIKFALEQLEKFRYQWKLLTMALRDKKGSTSLKGNTDILMSGLTLITGGVVTLYETIKKVNNNWSEMSKMQKIITLSIGVLSIAVISLGVAFTAMWAGATMGASKVIAGVTAFIISIGALIAIFVSEKDAIKSTKDALNDLKTAQEEYKNANNDYISAVDSSKTAFENLKNAEKDAGISGQDLFNKVQAGTLDYANMTVKQQEVYKAYLANDEAQIKLKTSTEKLSEAKKKETLASFDNQLAIAAETGNYNDYKKSVIDAYKKGEISADEARDLIEKSMSRMSDASQKTFMEDLPNDIKNGMNPDEYQTAGQKMKNWFQTTFNKIGDWLYTKFTEIKDWFVQTFTKTIPNGIITGIETMINFLINAFEGMINAPLRGINKIIRKVNDIPGIEISLLPSVDFKNIRIPRLAKGGIAMQPTQAIIGEAGREAVLPLENNTEWMDNLADKISSRNSGNLTVPIYLPNGKLLAQYVIDTIKKQEFAYNGGVL